MGAEISTWDLLKAISAFHDSLAVQLSDLAAQVKQIHNNAPPTMLIRRPSNSSERSCSSQLKAPPRTSRSARSQKSPEGGVQNIYSPSQSLAIQALHMDMPHPLLLNKASKAPVTKGHSGPPAMPSLVLVGHDCKREKKKRATVDSQSASHMELPGAMMPVLPNPSVTLESGFAREVSKQSLPVPNSEQPADSMPMPSGNSVRSDGPRHGRSSSERSWARLGPVGADFESEDMMEQPSFVDDPSQSPRPSSHVSLQSPQPSAGPGRSASNPVIIHQEQPPPRSNEVAGPNASAKREQLERKQSVSFLEKETPGLAVSNKASLPSSAGSRRKSAELSRAVSTGNLTEVFKVKEKELTADLQSPGGQRVNSKKIPTESIREAPSPLEQVELSSVQSSTDSEEEQETEKASADDQLTVSRSNRWWLKLNFLSNFLVLHASKALGHGGICFRFCFFFETARASGL